MAKALDFSRIDGIIWDLDNTLYRFDAAFEHACNIASARAAISLGVPMEFEEALEVAQISFRKHGFSGLIFEQNYQICRQDYHFKFHESIDEKIIRVNEEMKAGLQNIGIQNVILTNASHEWAVRTLTHLGLKDFFPDTHILGQENVDFIPKARDNHGFEKALEILNLNPENALMVDDLSKNLRIPATMGMQTALVQHHAKDDDTDIVPDWVDVIYDDTLELITDFQQA